MSIKMNPEIKAQWVAALRSGEYKQGQGRLNGSLGFCCLGVLCDLAVKQGVTEWELIQESHDPCYTCGGYSSTLPECVGSWAGFPDGPGLGLGPRVTRWPREETLADLNDTGSTFPEIADLIEAQL